MDRQKTCGSGRGCCQKVLPKQHFPSITSHRFITAFWKKKRSLMMKNLYYTENTYRSRKNYLSSARFLLWTQNETIRYYDIDSRDYADLLDGLNLDSFENIELSTEKFIVDYPDLMRRYDIRNRYELHNLLKKIIKDGGVSWFSQLQDAEYSFWQF